MGFLASSTGATASSGLAMVALLAGIIASSIVPAKQRASFLSRRPSC
jgi:hypothetical protein